MWHYEWMINFLSRSARFLRRPTRTKRLYCDYAAATPLSSSVRAKMQHVEAEIYGNASSIHHEGAVARQVVEDARTDIARVLGVQPAEVFFTGSGTEANNIAIAGYVEHLAQSGRAYGDMHIVTTAIEHPSVTEVMRVLQQKGVQVTEVPVNAVGHITVEALSNALTEQTILVTFAYANSEIGVAQPVRRLARVVRQAAPQAVIHIDAAQAPLWLSCNPHTLGVDMLSLDAGKCNGPKGIGVLVKKRSITVSPVIHGGGQESGVRAGTENTPAIAGAAIALKEAQTHYKERALSAAKSAKALLAALTDAIPTAVLNGPAFVDAAEQERVPNNVHISIPSLDTEYAVIYLDKHGIAASTKSACSGAGGGMSSVVAAISDDAARAQSTLRFTLDPNITPTQVSYIASTLARFIELQKRVD